MGKKLKTKPKRKQIKGRQEDFIQATHRVFEEVIQRSEKIGSTCGKSVRPA
jgi:hypothetical protein